MREIKFRAWNKRDNVMEYNVNVNKGKPVKQGYQWFNAENTETVYHSLLQQYTGLIDKNGKEIYEGDVLEAEHKLKTQKFKRKYQVIFNEKGYWDAISLDDKPVRLCYAGFDKCEVIGNIYENPELLEVQND